MATGMRTTATDSSIIRRAIADMVALIDWTEAPLLNLLGMNNEQRFRLLNWPQIKAEWLEDTLSTQSDALNGAMDASTTSAVVDNGDLFRRGDVIEVGTELMHVTSVSSNTLTVVRGYGDTTAASHSDNDTVDIRTVAAPEGAEAVEGHTTVTTNPHNYTQIIDEAVKVSGSKQAVTDYGISDTMAFHLAKLIGGNETIGGKFKAGNLPIALQKTFYHGKRSDGTLGERAMGGFNQYVTTNVTDVASGVLERKHVEDELEDIYLAGGDPDCMVMNTWPLRKFRNWFEGFITTERSEERGGSRITMFEVPWGGRPIELIFDRFCPNDELYIMQKDKMGWVTMRPWDVVDLPSTGDYERKNVVGEFSFVLQNEEAHGRIHSFSTTK